VTVIAGVGNLRTGEITLANAGHPRPLFIDENGASVFVETTLGPPLGVGPTAYEAKTFTMPQNSILVCFTDGLIERRGEDIDTGLDRLMRTVMGSEHTSESLKVFVSTLLTGMRDAEAADDIAVLALKRVQA
jgi:serine phosphatase RsbU (regulator of sigma subunit)